VPTLFPLKHAYLGWQESLHLLGKLLEMEIPE
jgi:hypothetical protein